MGRRSSKRGGGGQGTEEASRAQSRARLVAEADEHDQATDWLRILSDCGLLGRIWPGERVIVGTTVCKWTRRELLRCAEEIHLRVSAIASAKDLKAFTSIVSACGGKNMSVWCKGRGQSKALIDALRPVKEAPQTKVILHHLDIRLGSIRANEAEVLRRVLQGAATLRHLNLFDCALKPGEVRVLAAGLSACTVPIPILPSYAPATRPPVLRWRMLLPGVAAPFAFSQQRARRRSHGPSRGAGHVLGVEARGAAARDAHVRRSGEDRHPPPLSPLPPGVGPRGESHRA